MARVVVVAWLAGIALAGAPQASWQAPVPEPLASVWYRGSPDGAPLQDDLAAIRAFGFSAVTWPRERTEHLDEVRRQASVVGLHVVEGWPGRRLTPLTALRPAHTVDVPVVDTPPGAAAIAWRALVHGARVVSFDAGDAVGAGLLDEAGQPRPWVRPAADVARHLAFNGSMLLDLVPGPDVTTLPPRPAGLDIVLLQSDRLWVLVATNTSTESAHAVAELPPGLPPALWVDLLDGTEMSMLNRQRGPQWTFDLPPGGARLYAIDKPSR